MPRFRFTRMSRTRCCGCSGVLLCGPAAAAAPAAGTAPSLAGAGACPGGSVHALIARLGRGGLLEAGLARGGGARSWRLAAAARGWWTECGCTVSRQRSLKCASSSCAASGADGRSLLSPCGLAHALADSSRLHVQGGVRLGRPGGPTLPPPLRHGPACSPSPPRFVPAGTGLHACICRRPASRPRWRRRRRPPPAATTRGSRCTTLLPASPVLQNFAQSAVSGSSHLSPPVCAPAAAGRHARGSGERRAVQRARWRPQSRCLMTRGRRRRCSCA